MQSTTQFYSKLPVLESFFEVSDPKHYEVLPGDWYVGVTDIVNSSKSIDENKYKWVNILGASPIIGLMNASKKAEIPFSFAGDGCIVCFPPELLDTVKKVFSSSQIIGQKAYEMELRAGIYPVSVVREAGLDISVARFKVSDYFNQAVFMGGGLTYLEDLLKSEERTEFLIHPDETADSDVDFTGLECRWQEVSKEDKFVYSLLIQTNPELSREEQNNVYNSVLVKMREFFGFDNKTNPLFKESLKMTFSPSKLAGETKFRTAGEPWYKKLIYLLELLIRSVIGKYLMKYGKKTSETDWSLYKPDMVSNSDHRKFDDMLRLVISCNEDQILKFENSLDELFKESKLAYGIHKSESALITCMVFAWHRQHIHFVDGSSGGYVQASKHFKKRMKQLLDGTAVLN